MIAQVEISFHQWSGPAWNRVRIPGGLRAGHPDRAPLTLDLHPSGDRYRLRLDTGTFEWDRYGSFAELTEWMQMMVVCPPLDFEEDIMPNFEFQG